MRFMPLIGARMDRKLEVVARTKRFGFGDIKNRLNMKIEQRAISLRMFLSSNKSPCLRIALPSLSQPGNVLFCFSLTIVFDLLACSYFEILITQIANLPMLC